MTSNITYYFDTVFTSQELQKIASGSIVSESTSSTGATATFSTGHSAKAFYTQSGATFTVTESDFYMPNGQLLFKATGSVSGTSLTTLSTALSAFDQATVNLANVPTNFFNLATSHSITLNGASGTDTAAFTTKLADFVINKAGNGYTVKDMVGTLGTDTLNNIELVQFSDKTVNLGAQSTAQGISAADLLRLEELYVAFFNRVPDADGLQYWSQQFKGGQSLNKIAESFYSAGVSFSSLTGFSSTMSNTDFVNVIYKNVLGRADGADAGGLAYWTGALTNGTESRGSLVGTILTSAHTFKGDPTYGWVANLLDNKGIVANKFAVDLGLNFNNASDSITKTMAIAAAVTPDSIAAAVTLIGVADGHINLG